ncbi:MAG: Veg family protein [Clostridia bacterium]|nr:Veg family protein [Clostridia bacterium]
MIIKSDIDACKAKLEKLIGKKVRLTSNGGRKRLIVYEGIVESCYPHVFTVRCARSDESEEIVSYSYIDVLTRVVRIQIEAKTAQEIAG